jgi:hypothetical protein
MNPATTKLAQVASGTKRCERCGRTKSLEGWPVHQRWKRPLKICDGCLTESRAQAGKANAKRAAAKRAAKEREARKQQAAEPTPTPTTPPSQRPTVTVLLAKLEGYAMGLDDGKLARLIDELKEATDG